MSFFISENSNKSDIDNTMLVMLNLIKNLKLLEKNQEELNELKRRKEFYIISDDFKLYKKSLYAQNDILFFIAKIKEKKSLYLISKKAFTSEFKGIYHDWGDIFLQEVDMSYENSKELQRLFPFTSPISLRDSKTTFGCGDRLGLATPGHIRAAMKYDVYPVLAQQSIRELNLTQRNYYQVISDVAFSVFQEGYERGYGADGDHLKSMEDIDLALEAGMPMITLDLSDIINIDAASWSENKINSEFENIENNEKNRISNIYSNKSFQVGEFNIKINSLEAKRCMLLYQDALNFALTVDLHLNKHRNEKYDLEISIDETSTPTLPSHHLFIIKELIHRNIAVNSLAPRFIGEFQKGIDYIGEVSEFEEHFKIHCEIAKEYGNYKISIHSGSDKFKVYPIIGKYTHQHFHVKTAGTNWLEALRCVAKCNPNLYRLMHRKAFEYYEEALQYYHITADISKIESIDHVEDEDLSAYLDKIESRQLLHITYGGLLTDLSIRESFFNTLNKYEDTHYELINNHISKHMELLGIKKS